MVERIGEGKLTWACCSPCLLVVAHVRSSFPLSMCHGCVARGPCIIARGLHIIACGPHVIPHVCSHSWAVVFVSGRGW